MTHSPGGACRRTRSAATNRRASRGDFRAARPLVVVAGAGAGKTETMAARVVWLVANGFAKPEQVLGLTFTRKAAGNCFGEFGHGYRALPGHFRRGRFGGRCPTVSTYHAFAGSLLREYGLLPVEPRPGF